MRLFEAHFTFTPDDETSGEGMVTVSAADAEEAQQAVIEFLGEVPDLQIREIREVAELPEGTDFTPRTLQ